MASVYVHIPFCHSKCYYCGFHSVASLKAKQDVVHCIVKELEIRKNYLKEEPLDSIYFGGGTPSVLDIQEVARIIIKIREHYRINEDAEISFEVNPEDVSIDYFKDLRKLGINRISIGVQSLDDGILSFLNRKHSVEEAISCINNSVEAGIDNISIDLIYGIPGLSDDMWKESLERIKCLPVKHLSAYCLSIDENTVFEYKMRKGEFIPMSDEDCEAQYNILLDWAKNNGFQHYEISNFCKSNYYSRHNSAYWMQKPYLGVGPSAHSYNGHSRQWNTSNNANYITSVNKGVIPFQKEDLNLKDRFNEYILTSLRTVWGINKKVVTRMFGVKYLQHVVEKSEKYLDSGHLQIDKNCIKLTEKGMFISNDIISEIFI